MPAWLTELPHWEIGLISFIFIAILVTLALYYFGKIGRTVFEGISFVLTVFAIGFAVIQFSDAKEHSHGLESLKESASTHFVGIFPKNLAEINKVIAEADDHLDIMVDFVGYGHYSAPDDFDKYQRKIEDLAQRGKAVQMLIYERGKAQQIHDSQFTKQNFEDASGVKTGRPDLKFVAFCNKYNQGRLPTTKPEFDGLLFHKQEDYITDLLERGVRIRKTREDLPFYLWNEDDEAAIFSFLNEDAQGDREVSFRTYDARILRDAFKKRFQALWNRSQDVHLNVVNGNHTIDW